ncbi:hypothetical protein AQUCO_04500203v1 [Aquilegia coerulea]|uniref:Uncharacterized protein n=1 Tax=Aquilegia coerulea TaxID=218851 RepID=A0A2G5CMC1_AQUCA|nr:hypothetical protein AQUCO_04500203v1 [Aquilegia coerulea]
MVSLSWFMMMETMPKMRQMKFGDEHSSLYDQFERLTFEIQLNQAILRRSFSESNVGQPFVPKSPVLVSNKVQQDGRHSTSTCRMPKVLKKLLKPLCSSKKGKKGDSVLNNPLCWKTFGRSVRVY